MALALAACGAPRLAMPPLAVPSLPPLSDGPPSYAGLDLGYDISYPQCDKGDRPLDGAGFSVVGINNGRAYSVNPCFVRQWRAARRPRSIYVNSSYYAPNLIRASAGCHAAALRQLPSADTAHRDAYAIGCGAAEHALGIAARADALGATMWWIDVESSNSWDDQDLDLNRDSLLGQIERLDAAGIAVGLYSSPHEWEIVTGRWQAPWARANWLPSRSVAGACAAPGFSGAPVWLVQEPDPAQDPQVDVDHVCPGLSLWSAPAPRNGSEKRGAPTSAPSGRPGRGGSSPPA